MWHDEWNDPTLLYLGHAGLWWPGDMQIITLLKRSHSSWRSNRLMEMAARREGSWRGASVRRKWEINRVIRKASGWITLNVSEYWIIQDGCHGNYFQDQYDGLSQLLVSLFGFVPVALVNKQTNRQWVWCSIEGVFVGIHFIPSEVFRKQARNIWRV